MRILPLLLFSLLTISLVYLLHTRAVLPAPLGQLLSPQHGIWQNAEDSAAGYNADLKFPQLKGRVEVYFDERLVPHVFAEQENDAYFVQGYLHARFRLWQMELQTHAAAGRASEIIGSAALQHDRTFRRLGMGYAAEQSLKEMEADPATKAMCDAYTAGVNAYISALRPSRYPLEYKLIGYRPEPWSNLKTALFLKYMSYDLAGHDNDLLMTAAKAYFSPDDFRLLYPSRQDSLDPIIPRGTLYDTPSVKLHPPVLADSLYFNQQDLLAVQQLQPDRDNGSNNWAVSGQRTQSGAPILCNDPHLGLNLPSLWFEMQISTPAFNAYGVSFPGAPAIIIGFNDSCAFGFTNGGRDVKDYYRIRFKDESRREYWFNNAWKATDFRVEKIKVRDSLELTDSVAYTVFGPVMYDRSFSGGLSTRDNNLALRWTAHDPSNELKLFYLLDRARNYADYQAAAIHLRTPGQNIVFACKNGDIALRTQGNWPAKWKGQGDFVMPGSDSSFMWQGFIPMDETPYQYNPERGFVSSANQHPADSTYSYYLGYDYPVYRGLIINRRLSAMQQVTAADMMRLQTDNYNVFAETILPLLLKNLPADSLDSGQQPYLSLLQNWNLRNDTGERGATVFSVFWNRLYHQVYDDEFKGAKDTLMRPFESTLVDALKRDSAYKFIDQVETPERETLPAIVTAAFKSACTTLRGIEAEGRLPWARYKATRVNHLTKLEPFSRLNLPIGGGTHIINATKENHGPSWRMVVSLTPETEAYGIYPGGQEGNPGSRYYDNFVSDWAEGRYYRLWVMKKEEAKDKRIQWTMRFSRG